jgi:hypothetical protein
MASSQKKACRHCHVLGKSLYPIAIFLPAPEMHDLSDRLPGMKKSALSGLRSVLLSEASFSGAESLP